MNTIELTQLLKNRYNTDEWVFIQEVPNSTGFNATRRCDALAINTWPSKGLEIHGFEIKSSRSDWLNELKDPDKSLAFSQYCDRWWLVVAEKKIVKNDLPNGWGLLYPRNGKLVKSIGASKLDPKDIPKSLLISMLKQTQKTDLSKKEKEDIYSSGYLHGEATIRRRAERNEKTLNELRETVRKFEKLSGVRIVTWGHKDIGDAVKLVLDIKNRYGSIMQLKTAKNTIVETAEKLSTQIDALQKAAINAGIIKEEINNG
jgi:hypothetical protein